MNEILWTQDAQGNWIEAPLVAEDPANIETDGDGKWDVRVEESGVKVRMLVEPSAAYLAAQTAAAAAAAARPKPPTFDQLAARIAALEAKVK